MFLFSNSSNYHKQKIHTFSIIIFTLNITSTKKKKLTQRIFCFLFERKVYLFVSLQVEKLKPWCN